MARTNKVYLVSGYPIVPHVSHAVGQASWQSQVTIFAVAPTKKALADMLDAFGYRHRVASSMNDGFRTWIDLSDAGLIDMDVPALYATGIDSDTTIVRLGPDRTIEPFARRDVKPGEMRHLSPYVSANV